MFSPPTAAAPAMPGIAQPGFPPAQLGAPLPQITFVGPAGVPGVAVPAAAVAPAPVAAPAAHQPAAAAAATAGNCTLF